VVAAASEIVLPCFLERPLLEVQEKKVCVKEKFTFRLKANQTFHVKKTKMEQILQTVSRI